MFEIFDTKIGYVHFYFNDFIYLYRVVIKIYQQTINVWS
jgi:hypothetical protein